MKSENGELSETLNLNEVENMQAEQTSYFDFLMHKECSKKRHKPNPELKTFNDKEQNPPEKVNDRANT